MPKLKELIDEQFDFWKEEKEIDREPIERGEPDDHIKEHGDREWRIATDNYERLND